MTYKELWKQYQNLYKKYNDLYNEYIDLKYMLYSILEDEDS